MAKAPVCPFDLDMLVFYAQNRAGTAASVIAYNTFKRGIKSNVLFIGPSGCGKTHIWRCLQMIFPGRIVVEDVSNLTQDGWKGAKKWADLLRSPIFRSENHCICVLDEADKMLAPRYSEHANVSHAIQSEGLTMLEGACVDVKIASVIHSIDTSKISFVLCGAFSNKAHDGGRLLPHDGQRLRPSGPRRGALQGRHPAHPPEAPGAGLPDRAGRPGDGEPDPAARGRRHLRRLPAALLRVLIG